MAVFFSGKELLEIARGIESNGAALYQTLADGNPLADVKGAFIYLSGEEKKHLKVFEGMISDGADYEPPESYAEEYMLYLKSLIDNSVFSNVNKARERAKKCDVIEALDMGIQAEKDSMLFYGEMQGLVARKDQQLVGSVLGEEKKHLRTLAELKEAQKKVKKGS